MATLTRTRFPASRWTPGTKRHWLLSLSRRSSRPDTPTPLRLLERPSLARTSSLTVSLWFLPLATCLFRSCRLRSNMGAIYSSWDPTDAESRLCSEFSEDCGPSTLVRSLNLPHQISFTFPKDLISLEVLFDSRSSTLYRGREQDFRQRAGRNSQDCQD